MAGQGRRASSTNRGRGATIVDVARQAGVSTATVSRALAAPHQVTEKTRAAVLAAIKATGYTPNVAARSLRARTTRIVLALVPGMSNTFFTPILNAMEDTLSDAGYGLIVGDTDNRPEKESRYVRLIRGGQVDGVILFTGRLPEDHGHPLESDGIPIALVCNEIPGDTSLSIFDVANRQAAQHAVAYLIEHGHRRIAHIAGARSNIEAQERSAGYFQALDAAGIARDDALVWGSSFRFETGVSAAKSYLASNDRPTAVFSAADDAAIGFIKTLRDAGIRIPEDVSVVGFDDIDSAIVIDPALTTMHQPRAELGRAAAGDLLRRMARDAPDLPPTRLRLPCKLIVRDSVRPLRLRVAKKPTSIAKPRNGTAGRRLPAT